MKKWNDVVLVFGSARSGTSWLAETLAKPRGYRLLFEPAQKDHVAEGSVLTDRYLARAEEVVEVNDFLVRVFRNRINNKWIAQSSYRKFNMHMWPFLVKKKIVKFVRANLAISYIAAHFDMPIIYIRRNPYSCLYSQNRVKFPWLYDLSGFTSNADLISLIYSLYNVDITMYNKYTPLEILALRWCIENIFIMSDWDGFKANVIVVDYDQIAFNVEALRGLIYGVGLEPVAGLSKIMREPSSKTHPKSQIHHKRRANYESLWDKDHILKINNILHLFGYPDIIR